MSDATLPYELDPAAIDDREIETIAILVTVDYIDRHRDRFGVEPICAQLPIAPSTYYERKARSRSGALATARSTRCSWAADPAGVAGELLRLWRAQDLEAAQARTHPRRALHGATAHARAGPARRACAAKALRPRSRMQCAATRRPGEPSVRARTAEPAVGRRLHLRRHLARPRVRRLRHRCVLAHDRRLARQHAR